MQQVRRHPKDVTPQYEDAGLFKNQICTVHLELVPNISFNQRGDLIIRCFILANLPAEVVFAGRRALMTRPLVQELTDRKCRAYRAALQSDWPVPDRDAIRLPATIEGSWRRHLVQDRDGWDKYTYQLVAARCMIRRSSGSVSVIGLPPEGLP